MSHLGVVNNSFQSLYVNLEIAYGCLHASVAFHEITLWGRKAGLVENVT